MESHFFAEALRYSLENSVALALMFNKGCFTLLVACAQKLVAIGVFLFGRSRRFL